jgi:hypothetical protein
MSSKTLNLVLLEASIVGIGLVVLVYIFKQLDVYIPDLFGYKEIQTLFIVGALFHLLCEYTGVNVWYAKNYCKLLS